MNFCTSSDPDTLMKVQSVWWATALANSVFPVPGGPYSSTPYRKHTVNKLWPSIYGWCTDLLTWHNYPDKNVQCRHLPWVVQFLELQIILGVWLEVQSLLWSPWSVCPVLLSSRTSNLAPSPPSSERPVGPPCSAGFCGVCSCHFEVLHGNLGLPVEKRI